MKPETMRDKIRTDKCEVFYTKDTPHIDTIIQIPDEEQTKNWLTLSWLLSLQTSSNERYKIYVPEGTITDDFSIDMAQEVTNFARFYALFNKLPCTGDREGQRSKSFCSTRGTVRKTSVK